MTRANFIVQFPEFAKTAVAHVEAILAAAALEIDAEVWGAKADQGQAYLAAHKLALSPFGNNAQLVATGSGAGYEATVYGAHFLRLMTQVALPNRPY